MICTFRLAVVFDCVYNFVFNLILSSLLATALHHNLRGVLFMELQWITFQFVSIVGAEGQGYVGSKEDEPGPTGKMIKHSSSTFLLKTLGRI